MNNKEQDAIIKDMAQKNDISEEEARDIITKANKLAQSDAQEFKDKQTKIKGAISIYELTFKQKLKNAKSDDYDEVTVYVVDQAIAELPVSTMVVDKVDVLYNSIKDLMLDVSVDIELRLERAVFDELVKFKKKLIDDVTTNEEKDIEVLVKNHRKERQDFITSISAVDLDKSTIIE